LSKFQSFGGFPLFLPFRVSLSPRIQFLPRIPLLPPSFPPIVFPYLPSPFFNSLSFLSLSSLFFPFTPSFFLPFLPLLFLFFHSPSHFSSLSSLSPFLSFPIFFLPLNPPMGSGCHIHVKFRKCSWLSCRLCSAFLALLTVSSSFVTSPARAVAKYCNVHVCVYLSVCPQGYLQNHTRDSYQIFGHVAYGRGSVLLRRGDEIPRGSAILGAFFPIDNALYSIAFGTHTKTTEPIEMSFGMMNGLGPRNSVLRGVTIPEGEWAIWG